MKTIKLLLCGALVHACLLLSSAWVAPTVAQADAVARKSLESKQYSAVVEAYRELDPQALNDQSLYRLAIAQQKLDNPVAAQKALSLALEKNPKGNFASSPERLAILKDEILKAVALKAPPPDPMVNTPLEVLTTGKTTTTSALDAKAGETTSTAASASVNPDKPTKTIDSLPATKPMTASTDKAGVSGKESARLAVEIFRDFFWPAIVPGMSIILIGLLVLKKIRDRSLGADNTLEALVALREAVKKNKLLIEMAGNKGSELYKALEKLEPVAVKEIGRIAYRGSRDANELVRADQQLLQAMSKLESAPMLLAGAEPENVMAYIFNGRASSKFSHAVGNAAVDKPLNKTPAFSS